MAEEARNQVQIQDLHMQFEELKSDSERQFQRFMSDLKRLIVERFGTPLWISELSTMADEVRDRTILVKVHSQVDQISELGIYYVFSEIGMVEDARYLPTESGFHSRVRFRDKYSADWAFHYYNGKRLREGCYELEIHHVNDVIEWNTQRIANLQDVLGPVYSPAVTSDGGLLAEKLKNDKLLNHMEESTQIEAKDELVVAKEPTYFGAHKVFDEMPTLVDDNGIELIDDLLNVPKVESLQTIVQEKIEAAPIEAHRSHKTDEDPKELHILFGLPKVISCVSSPLEATIIEVALEEIMASDDNLVDSMEIKIAYNLFDEMPKRGINVISYGSWNFDPGGVHRQDCMILEIVADVVPSSPSATTVDIQLVLARKLPSVHVIEEELALIFDPGGLFCAETVSDVVRAKGSVGFSTEDFKVVDGIILSHHLEENKWFSNTFCDEVSGRFVDLLGNQNAMPFDRGKELVSLCSWKFSIMSCIEVCTLMIFSGIGCCCSTTLIASLYGHIQVVFDPGGQCFKINDEAAVIDVGSVKLILCCYVELINDKEDASIWFVGCFFTENCHG